MIRQMRGSELMARFTVPPPYSPHAPESSPAGFPSSNYVDPFRFGKSTIASRHVRPLGAELARLSREAIGDM